MRHTNILKQTHRRKKCAGNPKGYRSNATAEYERALQRYITGSHGAASPVKRIDPITGKVIEILDQPEATFDGPNGGTRV
jgi:hypothetical protein